MEHIEQIDSIKCEIEGTITAIKPDNYGRRLSIGTSTNIGSAFLLYFDILPGFPEKAITYSESKRRGRG